MNTSKQTNSITLQIFNLLLKDLLFQEFNPKKYKKKELNSPKNNLKKRRYNFNH